MLKHYFTQACVLLRQNRLFSAIYVLGTGLSIALAMTLFIVFYVKLAPIYPEYNRNRVVAITTMFCQPKDNPNSWWSGQVGPGVADLLADLPHLEAMAYVYKSPDSGNSVGLPGVDQVFGVSPMFVNSDFWRVFTFGFVDGKPFTSADEEALARVAVLSQSTAQRLFASTDDVIGRQFLYKGTPYTVCGVVTDVSTATPAAAADIWLPITLSKLALASDPVNLRGNLRYYLLATSSADRETLKEEVRNAFARHDAEGEVVNDLMGQPDDVALSSFRTDSSQAPDVDGFFRMLGFIVLALLFIPAINLSGMIASRMDSRTAELGIRQAYGATRRMLLEQVLWENLLLTLLGAAVGLLFCYIVVLTSGSWVLTLFDDRVDTNLPQPFLTWEMLFNPWVFLCALGLCLVLNVSSALLPALLGLRKTIVQELYAKR